MFGLALFLLHPKLRKEILKNHANLAKILNFMIPADLKNQMRQIWQDNLKGFRPFEDFLILSLLEKFLANRAAAYVAHHPNPCPPQCTFWQHHEDRIQQAAHDHAVNETLAFLDLLCEQKPGLPSDQQVFTQRLDLVGSVNDLCRQILQKHVESARLDLNSSDSGLCVQVPKIDCESVGNQISQDSRSLLSFDNVAALAADEAASKSAAKAADEAAIPYD
jgi:hypothetical protein